MKTFLILLILPAVDPVVLGAKQGSKWQPCLCVPQAMRCKASLCWRKWQVFWTGGLDLGLALLVGSGVRSFSNIAHGPLVHKQFALWDRLSQVQFPPDISLSVHCPQNYKHYKIWCSFSIDDVFPACIAWWTHAATFPFCTLRWCCFGATNPWEIHFLSVHYLVKPALSRLAFLCTLGESIRGCTPSQPARSPLLHFHRKQRYSKVRLDWPAAQGGCEI